MGASLYVLTLVGVVLSAGVLVPAAGPRRVLVRGAAGLLAACIYVGMPALPCGRFHAEGWLALLGCTLATYGLTTRTAPIWQLVVAGILACAALAAHAVSALIVMGALVALHAVDLMQSQCTWRVAAVYAGWLVVGILWTQIWWPGYCETGDVALCLNFVGVLVILLWSGTLMWSDALTRAALAFGMPVVLGTLLALTLQEGHLVMRTHLQALVPARAFTAESWRTVVHSVGYGSVSITLMLTVIGLGSWRCARTWPGLIVFALVVGMGALITREPDGLLACLRLALAPLAAGGAVSLVRQCLSAPKVCDLRCVVVRRHSPELRSRPACGAPCKSVSWSRRALFWGSVALVLLCAVVFSNTLYNEFQLDDFYSITDNPGIQRVHPIWRHFLDPRTLSAITSTVQYRPLLPLTLSLNYALHRYWLPGYHLFSISVHACSAVFCFLFFVHLLRRWEERVQLTRTAVAWWAAALYVVHPIAGFPVNYLVARDLLMMQMFLLAGLYVYVRLRLDGGAGWRWPLCLCLLLLALCAKTNAVTAPGMVFLLEFVVLGERLTAWRAWVRVAVWTVAVAGFLLWVRFGVGFSDAEQLLGGDCLSYLLTQFRVHVFNYLRNVIWPFEIRALPYVPAARSLLEWRVALGAAVIFGSLGTALALVRRAPFYSFCIFAYWGMAALESSVFPLHINVTDYRTYPSLPYLCLLIVLLVAKFPWRRVVYASLAVLTIYFGASAFYMNRHFRTGETFWRQSVRYGTHALGTMNYGMSLRGKNDREALRYLQRAVELNPNYYLGRINLGLCYISLGRHAEGIAEARAGAACASELCKDLAYFWLSQAYKAIGDVTQAYEAVRVALAHNQHNVEYLYEGSYLAQLCGDHATASAWLSNLHTRVENYQISRFMAGWSYQARGMNEAALAEYERAIAAAPDYPQVYANKGYALYALGRYAEAARAFEEHLRRVPGHPGSLISLSNCITRLKAKGD